MAKNRYINTRFWSDNFVSELNPLDRYLFLYFLTNEHTNICGIYEIPLRTISFETGIEVDMLKKMIKRLEGKIFYIEGWIYIKNFAKHQAINEKVAIGIKNAQNLVPSKIWLKIKEIDKVYIRDNSLSISYELPEPESELELKPKLELKVPFSFFKERYPRKENMKKAEVIWNRLSKDTQSVILNDIPRRKEGKQWKGGFIPHPTTYLNGERWNDHIEIEAQPVLKANSIQL